MHTLKALLGISCILIALMDAFVTVILPRRAVGHLRLTRLFYEFSWWPFRSAVLRIRNPRRRETLFSFFGPSSLVLLIALWALFLIVGFALCFSGAGSPFLDPISPHVNLRSDLYVSGTTLFTLGLGDLVPRTPLVRELMVAEAGLGLGFVALLLGYFPVLYGAFSRREVNIALLDARAGSPPSAVELMRRHAFPGGGDVLAALLADWERWAAELLESHISYPVLCFFRSQHTNQSWLGALCAVLDTCALMVASVQDLPGRQAQLTFAMARHAAVDLSQVFELEPVCPLENRLSADTFEQLHDLLCQAGTRVARDAGSLARLNELRGMYEPYVECLSRHLSMALPPFLAMQPRKDNWQTIARLSSQTRSAAAHSMAGSTHAKPAAHADEDNHIF